MSSYPTLKRITAWVAIVGSLFFARNAILALRALQSSADPSAGPRLAFFLFLSAFSVLGAWIGYRKRAALAVIGLALFVNTLALVASGRQGLIFFYFLYAGLYFLLNWFDKKMESEILLHEVEIEKSGGEKNQLEIAFKKIKEDLDASFSKYQNYFGLREVAEHFATTLSLDKTADLVIQETRHFIPKADAYLLYLSEVEDSSLSLIASHSSRGDEKIKAKKGDLFDFWVLKNRQLLLVSDTEKDFRFDINRISDPGTIRSVMVAPLTNEGRVVGTFRLNSGQPSTFAVDDLRLLDFLSVLASSAIANARLYQKTEELAIRDSLTGLYVQRHFKDRLKEEHRRALLTHTPLSLLMCDFDHFKNYNDTYGHAAGDMILVKVSEMILGEVREDGIVARYGGEELAVLLPRFTKEMAVDLAQRIRRKVESEKMEVRRELTSIAVSIGVSTLPDDTLEREELIRKADQNLYAAKRGGRNRVIA